MRLDAFENYKNNRSSSAGATVRPSAKFDAMRKPGGSNQECGPHRGRTLCEPTSSPSDEKCVIWTLNNIDKRLFGHPDVAASEVGTPGSVVVHFV